MTWYKWVCFYGVVLLRWFQVFNYFFKKSKASLEIFTDWFCVFRYIEWCFAIVNKFIKLSRKNLDGNNLKFMFLSSIYVGPYFFIHLMPHLMVRNWIKRWYTVNSTWNLKKINERHVICLNLKKWFIDLVYQF